jgi:predicted ATPase
VLDRLRIQNFKAWKDTGRIDLAPLTIFFGANSSGKSSINHFLMMLRQTVRSADRNNVFDFGDANAAVSLGSFRDVVFRHEVESTISFDTEWSLPAPLRLRDPRTSKIYSGDHLAFSAAARLSLEQRRPLVQLEHLQYRLASPTKKSAGLSAEMARDEKRKDRWRLETENYDTIRSPGRRWELPKPIQFYGFPAEAQLYYENTAFLSDLELSLETLIGNISYLGPLRSPPERIYPWSGNDPLDVGWQGEQTVQAILAARSRRLNWKRKSPTKPFDLVVADWLVKLGLLDSFEVEEIAPGRDEYDVAVKTAATSETVNLTDVGFGVSQVLPVIVQSFYAPRNSSVLMEQPEIHLHPAVQSALADLFIAAVKAREDGKPREIQIIAESHSEHLLRRLLRRIAEEEISNDDVALYFCYKGSGGSAMDRLEVNQYGDILNWPPDFFGDEVKDVAVQAEVGIQRKLALDS